MPYIPIIARVDSLPPLPESVIELERLFTNNDPDIDELVKIIKLDPSLTTDILSKVNAPYYGFSKSIVSVLQAVTLFGSSQIRSIVLASTMQRGFDIDLSPYNITTSEFSKISTMQSELIFQWYVGIDIDMARNLTTIAFLMETGKILIAKDILENNKQDIFLEDLSSYEDISYVENIHTMMSSAQISALVFKHFNLNDNFVESMKYLDTDKKIPESLKNMVLALQIVRCAVNIREQLTENSINNALELLERNLYSTDSFKRATKRIKNKYD